MPKKALWQTALVSLLLAQIVLNLAVESRVFTQKNIGSHLSYPGEAFLGLRPYLHNVPMAGYYTDQPSSHPKTDTLTMFPYQQAQYALSPTLLDYYHPFSYRWIIMNCRDPRAQGPLIQKLNARVAARLANGLMLIYRN